MNCLRRRAARVALTVLLMAGIGSRVDEPALLAIFQRFEMPFALAMLCINGLLLGGFCLAVGADR